MKQDFLIDIATVQRIAALPSMLEAVCRTSEMGFAAVARVTNDRWIACSVADDIRFGLKAGGELNIRTTICDEIRQHHQAVVINNVADDPVFSAHSTPRLYGFQSYISMPIVLPDEAFFGTLCAIDPQPHRLDTPRIIGMFKLFAGLIGVQIAETRRLDAAVQRFLPPRALGIKSAQEHIADHLLLARSIAAGTELDSIRQAVEIALYLTGRDIARLQ